MVALPRRGQSWSSPEIMQDTGVVCVLKADLAGRNISAYWVCHMPKLDILCIRLHAGMQLHDAGAAARDAAGAMSCDPVVLIELYPTLDAECHVRLGFTGAPTCRVLRCGLIDQHTPTSRSC
jgi:hypothetical protein